MLTFTQQGVSIKNKCCVCVQQGNIEKLGRKMEKARFKDKQKGHLHVFCMSAQRKDKESCTGWGRKKNARRVSTKEVSSL